MSAERRRSASSRCRAAPCAAGPRAHGASAAGTGSGEHERHWPLKRMSCHAVLFPPCGVHGLRTADRRAGSACHAVWLRRRAAITRWSPDRGGRARAGCCADRCPRPAGRNGRFYIDSGMGSPANRLHLPAASDGYASFSSSVRYFGARALAFSMNRCCCSLSSLGGAVVRVATGTPTSLKKCSCPEGE